MGRSSRSRRLLLAGGISLAKTANAWKPVGRRGLLGVAAFPTGWPVSELPLHHLAVETAVLGRLARKGAWRTPAGAIGLGLGAVSAAGLVALHRESARTGDVVEAALVEGLGADYRARIPEHLAPVDGPITRREVAFTRRGARRRYATARDIAYGDAGQRNLLDVWRRADLEPGVAAPVLLHVHGGGWAIGNKEDQGLPLLTHLAKRGWVGVSINYRLSPRATWPDHIADVKRAIGWIRANIADHGGDPSFVAVTGGSAGGHLAALTALSANDPAFQPGFEEVDTTVQAAVPIYGVYDFADREGTGNPHIVEFLERNVLKTRRLDDVEAWDRASPVFRVGPDAPPFFVLHGTNDSLAPVEQARLFVRLLREQATRPVAFAELPRAQHAFDVFASLRCLHVVRGIECFLVDAYVEHLASRSATMSAST